MSTRNSNLKLGLLAAILIAISSIGLSFFGCTPAEAASACTLAPDEHDPSVKILRCGDNLTMRAARGARFRPIYEKGQPLPAAVRLDDGALLIEFQPGSGLDQFQILTPLAIAAVRGTKWAVEVTSARDSTLVLSGTVQVTNRRFNRYVLVSDGEGVDITPTDTSMTTKHWGDARVRELLSRFGE